MKNDSYELTKFSSSPSNMVVPVSTGDVKQEFKAPCWSKYMSVLNDLRYLARFHNINEVMEALKRDLGIK
jgi:hypothetical protein